MIQANELRYGNVLLRDNTVVTIDAIQQKVLSITEECYFTPIKKFKPIPLTEDWLIKFGAKTIKKRSGICYRVGCMEFYYVHARENDNHWFWEVWYEDNCDNSACVCKKLEFVHQLQNLYFALKGQELTITL